MSFVIIFDLILILIHAGEKKIVCICSSECLPKLENGLVVFVLKCIHIKTTIATLFLCTHTRTKRIKGSILAFISTHTHTHIYKRETLTNNNYYMYSYNNKIFLFTHTDKVYENFINCSWESERLLVCIWIDFDRILYLYILYIYILYIRPCLSAHMWTKDYQNNNASIFFATDAVRFIVANWKDLMKHESPPPPLSLSLRFLASLFQIYSSKCRPRAPSYIDFAYFSFWQFYLFFFISGEKKKSDWFDRLPD